MKKVLRKLCVMLLATVTIAGTGVLPVYAASKAAYINGTSPVYHTDKNCSGLGSATPIKSKIDTCKAAGFSACPICAGGTTTTQNSATQTVTAQASVQPAIAAPAVNGTSAGTVKTTSAKATSTTDTQKVVYLTSSDSHYHTGNCKHITNGTSIPVTKQGAESLGYTKCTDCNP